MTETTARRQLDWTNTLFLASAHLLAAFAVVWVAWVNFEPLTLVLGGVWFVLCGLAITGGYHRLFAHPTYRAKWPVRLLYLLFGAASAQNSALKWSSDHRRHHAHCDRESDPYNIQRGFWWAHIGWIFFKGTQDRVANVKDLERDPLVVWQDRWYVPLALVVGAAVPAAIGALWGDALGALLVAGFLRLVFQWHATFAINSFTHAFGRRPYDENTSARDSWWTALITFGEGYHNFHHVFQLDYRNGVRWWQFDPTKWFVWTLSKVGLTSDLRRTPPETIRAALLG